MPEYLVSWVVELTADNPVEAAEKAREIHQDPASIATCFFVEEEGHDGVTVDLDAEAWCATCNTVKRKDEVRDGICNDCQQ